MVMANRKKRKKQKKSVFSKVIVSLVIGLNVAFTTAVLIIFMKTMSEPSGLIIAWFSFTTVELWSLAGIKKIKEKNLIDKVILAGQQENARDYYNAFDLYIFPSLFEGLGFVLIEAQANGLTCINSDRVPQETNLSGADKMLYLPLEKQVWVEKLLELGKIDRYGGGKYVIEHGYDITHEAKKLESMYLALAKNTNN